MGLFDDARGLPRHETADRLRQSVTPNYGAFEPLMEAMKKNPNNDLWVWVSMQDNVQKMESQMQSVFNAWMFEQMKPQFSSYCKENGIDCIDDYVSTALSTSKEYVSPSDAYAKKEEEYKNIIATLTRQLEQKNTEDDIRL